MQFNFTKKDHVDEFKFGGILDIVAENASEVESLISHFRLFNRVDNVEVLKKRIEALQSSTLSHVVGTSKMPIYEVSTCLDSEFVEPYKKWALDNFGYDGIFPDLTIPRKWGGLIHTNYQAHLETFNECICFQAFTSSEPWNGKDAQTYAEKRVIDYIGEEFGTRYHEPEFIPTGRGDLMKRNPNYLKKHPARPGATNSRLKKAFFNWWMENHANEKQKEIVSGNRQIVSETGSYMSAFEFEKFESHIYYEHTGNDYKSISFRDFAALGT